MKNMIKVCRFFAEPSTTGAPFDLGYLHGLAYPMDYDTDYQTVLYLCAFLQGRVNLEGERVV